MIVSGAEESGAEDDEDRVVQRSPNTEGCSWQSHCSGLSSWIRQHLGQIPPPATHRSEQTIHSLNPCAAVHLPSKKSMKILLWHAKARIVLLFRTIYSCVIITTGSEFLKPMWMSSWEFLLQCSAKQKQHTFQYPVYSVDIFCKHQTTIFIASWSKENIKLLYSYAFREFILIINFRILWKLWL